MISSIVSSYFVLGSVAILRVLTRKLYRAMFCSSNDSLPAIAMPMAGVLSFQESLRALFAE